MRRVIVFFGFLMVLFSMLFLYFFKDNTIHYQGDIRGARIVVDPAFSPYFEKLTIGNYEISGQLFLRYDRDYHLDVFGTNYLILLGKDGEILDILIGISGILFLLFLFLVLIVMASVDLFYRKKVSSNEFQEEEKVKPIRCSFANLIESPSWYNSGTNLSVSGGRVVYVKIFSDECDVALVVDAGNQKELSGINGDEVIILWLHPGVDLKEGDLLTEVVGELHQEEGSGLKTRFIDVEEFSIEKRNPQPIFDSLIDDFCRVIESEEER